MKPEIIEKIKDKKKEKSCEVQVPLYLPETSLQNQEMPEKEEKKESRVVTIDLA